MLALLRGLGCESAEIALAEGTLLAPLARSRCCRPIRLWRSEPTVPAPGRASRRRRRRRRGAIEEALERLRDLQTRAAPLRAGRVALGAAGVDPRVSAAWRPAAAAPAAAARRPLVVTAEQEDELRAFCNLVARRRPVEGELAWALERFELGCERDERPAALTDHLLALRALLEPEGPRSGRSPGASRRCARCPNAGRR